MRAVRRMVGAFAAVGAAGCASTSSRTPARTPADRSAAMNALVAQCRSGTATYTVKNELARRVAIYQTGGGSGTIPRFVDVLDAGESLQIEGLPITATSTAKGARLSTVYFFGSDDMGGETHPSPLRLFEQRSIKTKITCDAPKPPEPELWASHR